MRLLTGSIVSSGSLVSLFVTLMLYVYTLYFLYRGYKECSYPKVLKFFSVFVFILAIGGLYLTLTGELAHSPHSDFTFNGVGYLRETSLSVLPVFVFYYFAYKGTLSKETLSIWVPIIFLVVVFVFYTKRQDQLAYIQTLAVEREGVVSNASYLILALMPTIPFLKGPHILKIAAIVLCLSLTILGMKRGAILITSLITVYYLYYYLRYTSRSSKITVLILTGFVGYFGLKYLVEFYNSSTYFQERFSNTVGGDLNGRDVIFDNFLLYFTTKANLIQLILGNGAYGALRVIGNMAHNDWVEILVSNGIIGLVSYLLFFISFVNGIKRIGEPSSEVLSLIAVFLILLGKTFFSMSYTDIDFYVSMIWGYSLCNLVYKRNLSYLSK